MHAAKLILIFLISLCLAAPAFGQAISPSAHSDIYTYGDENNSFALWKAPGPDGHSHSLLKFENADEIWLVSRHLGSRGAVLYRNDTGRIVLRENPAGGATLYPVPSSRGVPVLRKGQGIVSSSREDALENQEAGFKSVEDWSRAYAYAGNTRTPDQDGADEGDLRGVDNRIVFQGWAKKDDDYRVEMSDHLSGFLAQYPQDEIDRIVVRIGTHPALEYEDTRLTIWVNPSLGYAGRPSSERILQNIKTARG